MTKQVSIKINGKSYPVKFGYGAIEALGLYLNDATYDGTLSKVGAALGALTNQEKEGGSLPFETLNTLGYLVVSGIECADAAADVDKNDIVDVLLTDSALMAPIFELFMASMPKAKADTERSRSGKQGNPKAPKKRGARQKN